MRALPSNLLLLLLLLPACFGASEHALPESKKDCSLCHIMSGNKPDRALKKPDAELCKDCHPDRMEGSEHKVGVVPAMRVNGLPLPDGKVACTTCHDPHSNRYGKLLRVKGRELCLRCHVK